MANEPETERILHPSADSTRFKLIEGTTVFHLYRADYGRLDLRVTNDPSFLSNFYGPRSGRA